ncbi:MAG TPA: phosphatase PAP2 family protein [Candidatus Aquicultor sp.]|jgi:undecaprenyl-diphosphatase
MKNLPRTPSKLGLTITIACLVLFIALTAYVITHQMNSIDTGFSQYLQTQPWAKPLLYVNTIFASSAFRLLYLLLLGILITQKRYRFGLLISLALASEIVTTIIKDIIGRPRPTAPLVEIFEHRPTFSYISGHGLEHLLLFGMLGYFVLRTGKNTSLKYIVAGLFFLEPVLVGLGRVYVGAHWLTDVLGSYLLGIAILIPLLSYFRDAAGTSIYTTKPRKHEE